MKLRKHHGILLSLVLSVSLLGGTLLATSIKDEIYTPTFATYTNGDADTYYNSLDLTKTGNDFLKDLRSLNLNKRQSTVGYKAMGTSPSGQYKYTDYDPNYVEYDSNGQPYGTRILSFYTYTSATSWNREHVWPNSHGGGSGGDAGSPYPDADIHMPRPTISSENSSRGNSFFVDGMNHSSNGWDPYTAGYSAESRGEAARITFYCTLVNSKLILAPNNTTPSGTDPITGQSYGSGHTMGNLETLIKWTINHPVTQRERNRNEGAEYLQGNRNPFVDHPEYACRIWGNVNSTIKNMCDNASWDVGNSVSISASSTSVAVDEVFHLTASVSSGTSQITWTSSDSTVVEVDTATTDSGAQANFTAVGPGTATITASSTIEGNPYTATCTVTVNSSGGSGGGGGDSGDTGDYTLITSNSSLSDGDQVVITTDQSSGSVLGVSGQNGTKDAAVSETETDWVKYTVSSSSSNGFKLYDESAQQYIASPGGNEFKHDSSGGTCSADSTGKLKCSNRYLCKNGTNYRFYTSVGSYTPFYVYKVNAGSSETKVLDYILVYKSEAKTVYTVGDTFVKPRVDAYYEDGDSDTVTEQATFTGYNMSVAGEYTVTVSYTLGSKTETDTYTITVNPAPVTLSSISLSGYQTSFITGDEFVFGGTVTAHYSDNTTEDVTEDASFTGYDMSVAGNQTVTVSYGGKTATYSITLTNKITGITSYTTEVSRIFHPGEFLYASDITVEDSNGNQVTGFEFDLEGHQITFEDSYDVDGSSHYKTFNNCIHWNGFTCNYAVRIERVAYVEPTPTSSVTDTIVANDLPATTTSYIDFTGVTKSSGAEYAGNSAKNSSGNIQLRSKNSNSGIVSTVSGGPIKSVTITVGSGSNQVDIYGKNTAYSSANDLYGDSAGTLVGSVTSTGTVTFETQYAYVGIRSNSGALYLSSIAIEYGSGEVSESPVNVSNYIMYENTNNQCLTKLDIALEKLNTLSQSDKNTFMTSNDYVIKCARERIQAWARNQGKEFELNNDNNFVINSNNNFNGDNFTDEGSTSLIVIICALSLVSTISLLIIKKRKHIK